MMFTCECLILDLTRDLSPLLISPPAGAGAGAGAGEFAGAGAGAGA